VFAAGVCLGQGACSDGLEAGEEAGEAEEIGQSEAALSPVTKTYQAGVSPSAAYAGARDTTLSENAPAANYGAQNTLLVDGDDPGGTGRDLVSLVAWDLRDVPPGSTVTAVSLRFQVLDVSHQGYSLFEAKRAWSEAEASWQRASASASWELAGARGASDRGTAVLGTVTGASLGSITVALNGEGIAAVQGWVNDPQKNHGFVLASTTNTNGLDLASREAAAATERPALVITYTPPTTASVPFVARGATWRYKDDGVAPASAWTSVGFSDGSWTSGPAELGYGDGDERTVIGFGPNASAKHITSYFRRTFTVDDPSVYTAVDLDIKRDDGAVVYMNGHEVFRTNMPSGAVTSQTLASSAIDDETYFRASVSPSLLVAGQNVLAVEVHQANGTSSDVSFDAALTGRTGTPQPSGDPVLVGAGDVADCNSTNDSATADLLDGIPGTVFLAGDNAYESGTAAEYRNCFDPTWGRHKARTKPVPGNHEYQTSGASGYFDYFGAAAGERGKGWYSYDIGAWHIVALNSNCSAVGGCGAGSAQEQWLRQDLAASTKRCTIAYWHHPRYSSGHHGSSTATQALFRALDDYGAELVIVGHEHDYERFVAMDANGNAKPNGVVEIVVGTGGRSLRGFTASQPPTSVVRNSTTWGVLKMTLRDGSLDYQFIPKSGQSFSDSGTIVCH
jgi:hypothetical protein